MSAKKNGVVVRDISDNRIITFGLDADKVDNVERAGFVYKKGNYTLKALFPDVTEDKTIDLGGSGGAGGIKLYRHIISAYGSDLFEFISTRETDFESVPDVQADIDTIIAGFYVYDFSEYGRIDTIVGYSLYPDVEIYHYSHSSSSPISGTGLPYSFTDTVIEL